MSERPRERKNRCGVCGLFRAWADLLCHFVPDTAFSSEDETWFECSKCKRARGER